MPLVKNIAFTPFPTVISHTARWKPCCAYGCFPPKIIFSSASSPRFSMVHFPGPEQLKEVKIWSWLTVRHTQRRQGTVTRKTPWLSVGTWKHNSTEDKREVGGSPKRACGKASFCRGQEKKWTCLLKTNADENGGTCCHCSSCKMRRRRQDFSRNGPGNGGLFPLLGKLWCVRFYWPSLNVLCAPCEWDGSWVRGESKPQPEASHMSTEM